MSYKHLYLSMNKEILEKYIKEGMSTYQIANEVRCSQTNIRYWLKKYCLSTKNNKIVKIKKCSLCGSATKCGRKVCGSCGVKIRRYRVKKAALYLKGNKCQACGWQGHPASLTFHHLVNKEFTIANAYSQSWGRVKTELAKCELLCANCHNERHCVYSDEFIKIAENYKGNLLKW